MENLKNVQLFLLDMDGTIYLEDELIDGATEFINNLIKYKKDYVFLTNNSSVNKNNYITKLGLLKIPCTEENIFSSGMATGMFLKTKRQNKKIYLVGTESLREELLNYGVEISEDNPDIVVLGFDRELTYQKIEKACYFLDQGAEFIATNADLLYPMKGKRYIPDCGSMAQMFINATSKKPYVIGKPNSYMIELLAKKHCVSKEQIAIIGDRLYTDIASGINAGIVTISVLTGETHRKMFETSPYQPDYILDSIADLNKIFK
jgi:HAD superfamily hydrolase (TIGR01457 family)